MRTIKGKLTLALVALAVMALVPFCGNALAEGHRTLQTGSCGPNATYEFWLDDAGDVTLEISGSGPVDDRDPFEDSYSPHRIIINNGITELSENLFYDLEYQDQDSLLYLDIAGSVKSITSHLMWSYYLDGCAVVKLGEGIESIQEYSLYSYGKEEPVILIPASVTHIDSDALNVDEVYLWVYAGSAGEQWCVDNDAKHYHVINGKLSTRETSMLNLFYAINSACVEVPSRYRREAISVIESLNLTASQMDALTAYVNAERPKLRAAMLDGALSVSEITGFVSRFVTKMNQLNIQVSSEIAWYNGYPGVRLTAGINGETRQFDISRSGDIWRFYSVKQESDVFTYYEVGDGLIVTGMVDSNDPKSITIPATIDGRPVYGVEGDYEDYSEALETLTLSEGIRNIGIDAFYGCETLTTLNLPDSLETIQINAFNDCTNLMDVHFGSHLVSLADSFDATGVGTLQTVELPASLEYLGRYFDKMSIDPENPHFETVDGVLYHKSAKTLLYYPSSKTTQKYTVKAGTVVINFCGNEYTKEVTLPDSVRTINECAFEGATALTTVRLNEGLTDIGYEAFAGCTALKQINFPSTLKYIGSYAFYENKLLKSAVFHEGLTHIGYCAFSKCAALETVSLPTTLEYLGEDVFDNCPLITSLKIAGPLEYFDYPGYMKGLASIEFDVEILDNYARAWKYDYSAEELANITIYDCCPDLTVDPYRAWAEEIGFNYVRMGVGNFEIRSVTLDAESLTLALGEVRDIHATIDSVGIIPEGALRWSPSREIYLDKNSTPTNARIAAIECGECALGLYLSQNGQETLLARCEINIEEPATMLNLPDSLRDIEDYAFTNSNVRYVYVPEYVETIGAHAFENCKNLRVIEIASLQTAVDPTAFSGCGDITIIRDGSEADAHTAIELTGCNAYIAWLEH